MNTDNLIVRKAMVSDFDRCLEIYRLAREFMRNNGNPNQWGTAYPPDYLIKQDIDREKLCCIECDGTVHGVFFMESGPDETYLEIEGEWLNNEPYYVIHRIASSGVVKGIFKAAVEYALKYSDNVKIDTHADNKPMQKALTRLGFKHCGTIYVFTEYEGRAPRMAYHFSR